MNAFDAFKTILNFFRKTSKKSYFESFFLSAAKLELQQRRQQSKPANSRGSRFTDIPQDPKSFLADEERDDKPKMEKPKGDRKPQNGGEKREKKSTQPQQSPPQPAGRQIVGRHKKSPKSQQEMSQNLTEINTPHQDNNGFNSDFTNLTISVSKDGEYKSVRLSQAPLIGSGRVGPRQITKTQFQGIEPEIEQQQQQQHMKSGKNDRHMGGKASSSERQSNNRVFNRDQKRNSNNNNFRQNLQKSSPQVITNQQSVGVPVVVQQQQQQTLPNVKQFSVQDRLKRAQATGNNNNSNNKNLILNIIAANEILTEERN